VAPDPIARDWIEILETPLPVGEALSWAVAPGTGALVTFSGTVRDHSDGRDGVESLDYEAYLEPAVTRLVAIAEEARVRWPAIDRLVLLHRIGHLEVTEISVLVAVSTPHRAEAFDAARYCIDTLKQTVPIWKRERWREGADWALAAETITTVETTAGGGGAR
jgi:molybdopterin synthase catalytic subunit